MRFKYAARDASYYYYLPYVVRPEWKAANVSTWRNVRDLIWSWLFSSCPLEIGTSEVRGLTAAGVSPEGPKKLAPVRTVSFSLEASSNSRCRYLPTRFVTVVVL